MNQPFRLFLKDSIIMKSSVHRDSAKQDPTNQKAFHIFIGIACLSLFFANSLWSQQSREDIADQYKWDLTHLYPSDEAWNEQKNSLVSKLPEIEKFKGQVVSSAKKLLSCFEMMSNLSKEASRLYIYSSMNSDLDKRDMKYSSMEKELQQIFSDFSAKTSFIEPEILATEWDLIEGYIREEPGLLIYKKRLTDLFRNKEHILSEPEERIMALSGMMSGNAYSAFSTFNNSEMPNAETVLSTGERVTLNSTGFSRHRTSVVREDRRAVFNAYYHNLKKFEATYGELLYGQIKSNVFYAKARKYPSALESSLFPNQIPVEVYLSLVENVNKNLPAFHRYLNIKKRMLHVDTLKHLDMYAPVVKNIDLKYTFDQAKEMVLKSLDPLGPEYVSTVKKAFSERWIDVYPTTAKRSGAYSNGAAYDVHPYILLNYNDKYNDVSTLTHELGHTMHSYYSNKTQPYPTADYTTFVAEVASTFNEVLLFHEVMKSIKDDDVRLSILMQWLDSFKGTLFRQTQFAEFELRIHEAVEKGKPLTGDYLTQLYGDILKRYYGHDKGICYIDEINHLEWAIVPHFYYGFYVYQYSTSFTASISLAERVMNKEKGALEKYINFLSSGGSNDPISLLKGAGVDMTSSAPFDKTIAAMNQVMDEIEKILDKKEQK